MTKKNSTKKALITSALCLLLCVSMLVGATFAWFTDSVSTTNNIITAGNLDVNLYYKTTAMDEWAPVKADTNVFSGNLWEPGHTEVVYLKVVNEGTLALKYSLDVNVDSEVAGTNVAGESFKLSDYILYNVYEGVKTYADSAAARGDESGNELNAPYNKAAQLLNKGESVELTMVVFMPTTVGNVANYKTGTTAPVINMGINLFATQYVKEEDSYGPDYDGSIAWNGSVDTAWYDANATEFVIGSAEQLAGFAKLVNEGTSFAGKTVKLDSNIDLANLPWTPISSAEVDDSVFVGFQGTFDGQGYTIANLNVEDDTWGLGLFGYMNSQNVVVKNVNVHNATVNATDCAGIIVGYTYFGTFSNIHVTGDVVVSGSSADGHVGGIAGCGYYATFENCSVIANGEIVSGGSFVGGIVGYQCANTKSITGCTVKNIAITGDSSVGGIAGIIATGTTFSDNTVEGVVLTKTRAGGYPKVGALIGCYDGSRETTLANCAVKDVTLNGANEAYAAYNELYGAGYDQNANANFVLTNTTTENITNNLVEVVKATTNTDLKNALTNNATVVVGSGDYSLPTLSGKEGITIIGAADGSTVVGGDNAGTGFGGNFGKNTTIQNVTFSGTTNGVRYSYAQGGTTVFDNCTFSGDSTYGFHIDESNGATFIFNNCTFVGFNAFAADLASVTFNNCTFLSNGYYGHTNIWSVGYFNDCTWGEGATFGPRGSGVIYIDGVQQ